MELKIIRSIQAVVDYDEEKRRRSVSLRRLERVIITKTLRSCIPIYRLLPADEDIAINAQDVFKNLCMGSLVENSDILMVSPLTLKQSVLRYIDQEILMAKSGAPGTADVQDQFAERYRYYQKADRRFRCGRQNPDDYPRYLLPQCGDHR